MDELPQLMDLAYAARSIHERLLRLSYGNTKTAGSCLYGTYLLAEMLKQFMPGSVVTVRGGDGQGAGGYQDALGQWHGHYWVELEFSGELLVMDITADQFGSDPVVVLPLATAFAYIPGCQALVEEHLREVAVMRVDLKV